MSNTQINEPESLEKKNAVARSKNYTYSISTAAITIDTLHNNKLDIMTVANELAESAYKVAGGNILDIELMLMTQAQTLNVLFHNLLNQIVDLQMINQLQILADIALRAQNQSRKTLAVLASLKNPHKATFIKQQNNALNQQVNNVSDSKDFKIPERLANELVSEVTYEKMDIEGSIKAVSNDTPSEALAALHRAEDALR